MISQNWLVRSASEVEQNIVSVERMLHYIELKPEAPYEIPETHPEGAWPTEGLVEFRCFLFVSAQYSYQQPFSRDYSLRYRPELDLVLKNISMTLVSSLALGYGSRTD